MTQLLQVLHNVCRFYLDFVKAFDRFHNKLLLKKLHRFGICSCPVDLVRRLSHWPRPKGHRSRSQRPASPCVIRRAARINTWTSLVPHICRTEWPSGDVATSVSLFADDKRCFWQMKSLENGACLQRDLEHINAWCDFCPGVGGGGGYFGNFWVGMCSWDPGTHNLNQS